MSAPKKPAQNPLRLVDPNNVTELFANELSGIHIHGGNCHFTLSVVRPTHADVNADERERVVAGRVVVTIQTAEAMVKAYGELKAAMKLNQMSGSEVLN